LSAADGCDKLDFMADFQARLETHIPALRRYARVLLRDPDQADDLVQDCLERALARRWLWRRPGNFRAWLFTIMHNLHANQVRNAKRRPDVVAIDQTDALGWLPNQIDAVAVSEIMKALAQLNVNQREVLVLVAVEGLRYAEVAKVLGLPIGTVMSRLGRARKRLRQITEGDEPPLRRVQ
jgi:RNA polymerase sigma-70 factor (ECF subfamily)